MANYESHYLYGQRLKANLLAAGVLEEIPFDSEAGKVGNTHILHFAKCNAEEWALDLEKILDHGVVDCSKKKPDGNGYGVRRDYTPEEKDKLEWWPVQFNDDGSEMAWVCKWIPNADPAYYASWAVPNQILIHEQFYEGTYDGGIYLQNGQQIAIKPKIPDGKPRQLLRAAKAALKELGLDDFIGEMVRRYMSVTKKKNGKSRKDQKIAVIMDYVYVMPNGSCNMDDAYTEEEKQVPGGSSIEDDSELPF